jgi:hypothetical protein
MTTMLAIKFIEHANPAWARSQIGPLADLKADIKKNGIQQPILIKRDFLMIDGARRLVAAKALHMADVPVTYCDNWATVMAEFHPNRPDCLPMDWPDLLDFWVNVLKPMQTETRWERAIATRRTNAAIGERAGNPVYSQFLLDLAKIYEVEPATVKILRDTMSKLRKERDRFPKFVDGVLATLPSGEAARELLKGVAIKSLFERVIAGSLSEDEGLVMFGVKMRQEPMKAVKRASPIRFDPTAPATTLAQLESLVEILERVGPQASEFVNFKIEHDDIIALSQRMGHVLSQLSGMRRRLDISAARLSEKK